jgi:endonuclease G
VDDRRDVAVTNRHVASIRVQERKGVPDSRASGPIKPFIDFREEHRVATSAEVEIEKVLFISEPGDGNPDVAFVKVRRNGRLPDPIPLFEGKSKKGQSVVVIGYPANDPRNPAAAVSDIFGRVFEVKRLSPGLITGNPRGFLLSHDASTLGGNSGSVVVEVESGRAVGLHFAGRFRENNFGVEAGELKKLLRKLKVQVAVPPEAPEEAAAKPPDRRGAGLTNASWEARPPSACRCRRSARTRRAR